jgi:hypothetical protein
MEAASRSDFAAIGTVFLNGWKLRYLSGDHDVREIHAMIDKVALDGRTLRWVARGQLSDRTSTTRSSSATGTWSWRGTRP